MTHEHGVTFMFQQISPELTVPQLYQFLGMGDRQDLRDKSRIDIIKEVHSGTGDSQRVAYVTVPQGYHQEIPKFNGLDLDGYSLLITPQSEINMLSEKMSVSSFLQYCFTAQETDFNTTLKTQYQAKQLTQVELKAIFDGNGSTKWKEFCLWYDASGMTEFPIDKTEKFKNHWDQHVHRATAVAKSIYDRIAAFYQSETERAAKEFEDQALMDQDPVAVTDAVAVEETVEDGGYEEMYFRLDLRNQCNNFNLPTMTEVIEATYRNPIFQADDSVVLQPIYREPGVYKVQLSIPIKVLAPIDIVIKGETHQMVGMNPPKDTPIHEIFYPFGGKSRNEEAVFITIQKAFLGDARILQNADFDKAFATYGALHKQTQLQAYKNTNRLNGNRYIMIIPKEGKDSLPSSIDLDAGNGHMFTFRISYQGQKWFCRRCVKQHVGRCPVIRDFER